MDLWNRGLPDRGVVRPLNVHEFDALVVGKLGFEADGLVVAEADGRLVGWVHAGFGPSDPCGPVHRLDTEMGTLALFVAEAGRDDPEMERGLILAAERYLRRRGAEVIYAGGQYPLNPFYWGLYGGSEFSGLLGDDLASRRAVERAGYVPSARTVLLEADLSRPEPRDPRSALLRRQVRLEVVEDAMPAGWWEALAIGLFRPTTFRLIDRAGEVAVASATTWDVAAGVATADGRTRAALIDVRVDPTRRRRGLGRLLILETLRHARAQLADLLCVQTAEANAPALALYDALGFDRSDVATLYRLPAELLGRSGAEAPPSA